MDVHRALQNREFCAACIGRGSRPVAAPSRRYTRIATIRSQVVRYSPLSSPAGSRSRHESPVEPASPASASAGPGCPRPAGPAARRSRDPRCPAYGYLSAAWQCPVMAGRPGWPGVPAGAPGYRYETMPGGVERVVERPGGNPSATGAVSAIPRVIGAANARSGWGHGYGKEKVYGSIP
jgi:hypothetical protein